jgi:ABC-type Fe3+/spermidine/putrescine transport system ATPase subunit
VLRLSDIAVDVGGFSLRVGSLEMERGEYLMVLGPNGAGKTVLLETVAGLHPVLDGRVEFLLGSPGSDEACEWTDVTTWPPERREVGFVYQDYLLFPHLSVGGNIGFGLKGRVPTDAQADRVREAAALTGVEGLLGRRVAGLSGGEQQKVALARALAIRPRLLLLDEPLAALDRSARRDMAEEVKRLCRELRVTVIHVTHSLDEAVVLGDRIAVLAEGRLLQTGPPAEVLRAPESRRVAELVGCENLLDGALEGVVVSIDGGPTLMLDAGSGGASIDPSTGSGAGRAVARVTVALRAEDLMILPPLSAGAPRPSANVFPALVETLQPGPAHWTLTARYVGATLGAAAEDEARRPSSVFKVFVLPPDLSRLGLAPGSPVELHVEPARVRICPSSGTVISPTGRDSRKVPAPVDEETRHG